MSESVNLVNFPAKGTSWWISALLKGACPEKTSAHREEVAVGSCGGPVGPSLRDLGWGGGRGPVVTTVRSPEPRAHPNTQPGGHPLRQGTCSAWQRTERQDREARPLVHGSAVGAGERPAEPTVLGERQHTNPTHTDFRSLRDLTLLH